MKKNKVFVNKIEKRIGNNQSYCDIEDGGSNTFFEIKEDNKDISNIEIKEDTKLTVKEKLDNLFKINGYVFNVDVTIITYSREYHTKIAGKVNNHIITLDNDIININDIKDIIIG